VLGAGLTAILACALVILLQSSPRLSGTNLTADVGNMIGLAPGQVLCEPGEIVPGDTGAIRLEASPASGRGPALSVTIARPTGTTVVGALAAGWRAGAISIPLRHTVNSTLAPATVCLHVLGPGAASFGGSVPDGSFVVQIDGRGLGGRLRIEYMRPGSETWLSLLPELARRASFGKGALIRHWAFFAAIALMLVAVALAARAVLSQEATP